VCGNLKKGIVDTPSGIRGPSAKQRGHLSATDAYMANDPVIANQTLSEALTAIATGNTVEIYVSGTVCKNNRPTILEL
jgi:hypothetical protein